jgi:hypothetical protein
MYSIDTHLDLDESAMHIQSFMNRNGTQWIITHKDKNTLSFIRTQKPSILAFLILLMFFVLPAILYLIFAWKKQTCNYFLKKVEKDTRIMVDAGINTQGRGRSLQRYLAQFDDSVAALPTTKLTFWESNKPMYIFFGTIGVVLVMIAILAILPR